MDVPDSVLENAWTEEIQQKYDITRHQFYDLRKERGIEAKISRGRPSKVAGLEPSRVAIVKAEAAGQISDRTARRQKQLMSNRPAKQSNRTQNEHDRGKLCAIYNFTLDRMDRFLAHFIMVWG